MPKITGLTQFENNVSNNLLYLDQNFTILANALNAPENYTNFLIDSGPPNFITATNPLFTLAAYADGQIFAVRVTSSITSTSPTLNINGLGAKVIYDMLGRFVNVGMIIAGQTYAFIYNSTLNGGVGGFNLYSPDHYPFYGGSIAANAETAEVVVAPSATPLINAALSNVFYLAMNQNVTSSTITNSSIGQTISVFISQDSTGSRTITWPANFKWAGGTPGVLSTIAGYTDLLTATYRSDGNWYASLQTAYQTVAINTLLLMHFDGTNGSTSFVDVFGGFTSTNINGVSISTAQYEFGGASIYVPAAGNSLVGTISANGVNIGSGDFTVEFWAYPISFGIATNYPYVVSITDGSSTIGLQYNSGAGTSSVQGQISISGAYTNTTNTALTLNAWNPIALVRKSGNFSFYLNGNIVGSSVFAPASVLTASPVLLQIGGFNPSGAAFTGYVDELRISSIARYTTNYTPTGPFPNSRG